jgi:GDP-6-deoxy-D-talose 4-dehydrogenase
LKILLTGASGFTGRHLAALAPSQGHETISLDADLRDPLGIRSALSQTTFDAVIHLAGISFPAHTPVEDFYTINAIGSLHLLDELARLDRPNMPVLMASSAIVYGSTTTSPLEESMVAKPINHYGISKWAMEGIAGTFKDRLRILITRPFNYTGPGQNESFLIPKLVKAFKERQPILKLGNIEVEREFNDVEMVCRTYLKLIDHPFISGEIVNVCSGKPHCIENILTTLENLTNHKPLIEIDPYLVRPNEIKSLCGNPTKLLDMIGADSCLKTALGDTLLRILSTD